jgi:hypothetical protein
MAMTPKQEIALKEVEEKLEQTGGTMSAAQKAIMVQFGKKVEVKPKGGFRETGPKIEGDDLRIEGELPKTMPKKPDLSGATYMGSSKLSEDKAKQLQDAEKTMMK